MVPTHRPTPPVRNRLDQSSSEFTRSAQHVKIEEAETYHPASDLRGLLSPALGCGEPREDLAKLPRPSKPNPPSEPRQIAESICIAGSTS